MGPEWTPWSEEDHAFYLFAAEINEGIVKTLPFRDRTQDFLITPFGAVANRVLVEGQYVFSTDVGSEGNAYLKVKVKDPTGNIPFYVDRYQDELFHRVQQLPHGERIRVTALVRSFVGSSGDRILSLRGVEMRVVEAGEERTFALMALKSLLGRIATLKSGSSIPTIPEGISEDVKTLFSKVDWERWHPMLKGIVEWLSGGRSEDAFTDLDVGDVGDLTENEEMVFDILKELSRGGEAKLVDLEAYVKQRELSMENVMDAVNSLLEKGVIYEPVVGIYKIV